MEQNPVERLRQKLKAWAASHTMFRVTDGTKQYAFDEDSMAFAAIGGAPARADMGRAASTELPQLL